MSSPVEMPCPNCKESLRIPPAVFGKKIKCKHCGHAFVVQDPDAKPPAKSAKSAKPAKPTKPGAKPPAASPPPPPPPPQSLQQMWDEEDAQNVELIKEEDVARCPHCALELDPPDARVCIHCGFNNLTRARAETKRVWAPDAMDWFMHLLPGIVALAIAIGLIVFNIISIVSMRDWLSGTFLEMDEVDASGRKRFYVPPGAFIFLLVGLSLPMFIPSVKFAFRRLAIDYRPAEKLKT
jgi:DNA-directed RNA polymerase subunit RPC12/RpoP